MTDERVQEDHGKYPNYIITNGRLRHQPTGYTTVIADPKGDDQIQEAVTRLQKRATCNYRLGET